MDLTLSEKKILLCAARESIRSSFEQTKPEPVDYCKYPELKLNAGAFVTLRINSNLRGCIGYIVSNNPLYDTVCDAAKQAAFSDPRFPQLRKSELEKLEIEISVLSPPFEMKTYDDIKLGEHGLILNDIRRKALLLPQVPVEYNMNRDEYLSALCEKAGLHPDTWRLKQLNISLFTASVFSELELLRREDADS